MPVFPMNLPLRFDALVYVCVIRLKYTCTHTYTYACIHTYSYVRPCSAVLFLMNPVKPKMNFLNKTASLCKT